MRPLLLSAQGFTAFRERVDIDFEGVDFFALVGPTGSGKSSVIDAMCFALYGCVPRYEDERAVAPAITMGASEARVSLTFEIAGERFIATRVVRRQPKGGATTKEARLERVFDQGTEVLAGTADEVTREIERRLGLVFKHFTRCVVLPQGEFARFLHDKPSERQQLLVSLLDIDVYERMGQSARRMAETIKNDIAGRQLRLSALSFATKEAEVAARERIKKLGHLRVQLTKGASAVAALEEEAKRHALNATSAVTVADLLAKIKVPTKVLTAFEELRAAEEAANVGDRAVKEAEGLRKDLERQLKKLPELAVLTAANLAHSEVAKLAGELDIARESLKAAISQAEYLDGQAEAAVKKSSEAATFLEGLRRQHTAVELAVHLAIGGPCPVCLQNVAKLPRHSAPAGLTEAQRAAKRAEEAKTAADKAETAGTVAVATETSKVELLTSQRHEAAARTRSYPDVQALTTLLDEVNQRNEELQAARGNEEKTHLERESARAALVSLRSALESSWPAFDSQRDPVVALGPPKPGRHDLVVDWTTLSAWASEERPKQLAAAADSHEAAAKCMEEFEEQLRDLALLCVQEDVTLGPDADLSEMREAAVAALSDAEHVMKEITDGIAEAKRLITETSKLSESMSIAELLGSLLRSTGFQRWLVGEALDLLVEGASDTLLRLSGRQYSLARDDHNEFVVVDHRNADERRSAKTLSGGETFQASLALALALADQLSVLSAEGGAKLESIFLDEGFGTLDPETLATVADTIESLGSDERMVGVVTHVRELADRIPVRYEVAKSARTSTVERHTA